MENQKLYRFGEFQIDAEKCRLWHGGDLVPLTPKEFEVLFYLVQHSGQIAEKTDLLDTIWEDSFVEESTLARNISWLRKKLAEFAPDEQFIKTVPKRGYQFTAEVEWVENDENVLIIEEQTIQQFRSEESITISDEISDQPMALPRPWSATKNQYLKFGMFVMGLLLLFGTGFTIYQRYSKKAEVRAIIAKRVVALTGETGREDSPRFSPDGKRIVYTWNRSKEARQGNIYVRLIDRGDSLQLTDSQLNDRYPTFSADGSEVAFLRDHNTYAELITVPSLGGREKVIRRLFVADYSMSYSPDGENLAVIDTENSKGGGQYTIYLLNTKTFERKRLTAEGNFKGDTTPRFSPDGRKVAFVRILEKGMDLFVVSANGGEPKRITFDKEAIHSLAWEPNGENIYFVSERESNKSALWRIAATGGEPELISIEGGGLVNLGFSPDGKTLAYSVTKSKGSIYRVKPDGEPPQEIISSNSNNIISNISPDGSSILFLSDRIRSLDLWTANTEGKETRRITDSMKNISSGANYSSDSSLIAFNGTTMDDKNRAFIVSTQSGKIRELRAEGHIINSPMFGADDKWMYFYSNKTGDDQIWKIRADGSGEPIQITRDGGTLPQPTTDGQMIYYQKSLVGGNVWRVPTVGGKEEKVTKIHDAGLNSSFWRVVDKGIVFLVPNNDKTYTAKFYDFANDKVIEELGYLKLPSNMGNLDIGMRIATDGENILFTITEVTSNIMIAELAQ